MPSNKDRVINPWVPSRVIQAGLEVDYEQADDGTWSYRLTDPLGHVVQSRAGYNNASGVAQAVNTWIRDKWKPERKQQSLLGPGTSALQRQLAARADENEAQAIRLREQADRLETEAKKLRAAADVLGEDYG